MRDHAPFIERAFSLEPEEGSSAASRIEGEIPGFVRGAYFMNGPGRFARAQFRYQHWLDGDGLVSSLRFEDDTVRFTCRFVRTTKFVAEENSARALFRTFGTAFESDRLKRGLALESPANVSVYPFDGKLLAFGEHSLPYQLDSDTLETRGLFDFGAQLNELSAFSAHPKFDSVTGEMFNFGLSFSSTQTALNIYKFERDGRLAMRARHRLPASHSMHDFGLSENYVVFYLSPYYLDLDSFLKQGRSLMASMRWCPADGSRLLVASRDSGAIVCSISIGNRFCLHLTNCFEQDGHLVVDLIELDRPVYDQYAPLPHLFRTAPRGGPVRFTLDLEKNELANRLALPYDCCPDFPAVDTRQCGRAADHFWMLGISAVPEDGRKFFDELVHLNWMLPECRDIYRAPAFTYLCGEPAFVANPESDADGIIVIQMFDACSIETSFAIFRAFDIAAGPIARIYLDRPVPLGFHTTFIPAKDYAA